MLCPTGLKVHGEGKGSKQEKGRRHATTQDDAAEAGRPDAEESQMRPGDGREEGSQLQTEETRRGQARATAEQAQGMGVRKVRRGVARAEGCVKTPLFSLSFSAL